MSEPTPAWDNLLTEADWDNLTGWPNCTTPDCENKQCLWGGLPLCFPCSERVVGREEMIRRYNATHDTSWEEV